MGNVDSKDESIKSFKNNLDFKSKIECKSLGVVSLYKDKIDKIIYMKKKIKSDNDVDSAEILKRIKDLKDFESEFNIPLKLYTQKKNDELFLSFYKFKIYFQFYNKNLKEIITDKRNKLDHGENTLWEIKFKEEELWYILNSLTKYSIDIKKLGYFNDDLQPYNIYFNKGGDLKIYPNFVFNYKGIIHKIKNNNYKFPLAPEIIELISNKNKDIIQYNSEKNIIWNIGISLLCAASLNNYDLFYNHNYSINFNNISREFIRLKKIYSKNFVDYLEKLCKFDPELRPNWSDILDYFDKFEILK